MDGVVGGHVVKLLCTCAALAVCGMGCIDTGQDRATVPLLVAGTDVSTPPLALGDVPVTLNRADLAFGPLYLCAGANAGDLCETARFEWLESVVVDATVADASVVGELSGITGTVRSWMYDLGFSSQLTRNEPFVLEAAQALGEASLVLEGRALVSGIEVPFVASVAVQQTVDTELGVPVVRKSTSDEFFRDVVVDEPGLLIRFDPAEWIRGIDFRPFVANEVCTEGGATLVCDGTVERSCDGSTELSNRDCGAQSQICLPTLGCQDQLVIETETQAHRSVRNALLSGRRPSFEWN